MAGGLHNSSVHNRGGPGNESSGAGVSSQSKKPNSSLPDTLTASLRSTVTSGSARAVSAALGPALLTGHHNFPLSIPTEIQPGKRSEALELYSPRLSGLERALLGSGGFYRLNGVQQMVFGMVSGARSDSRDANTGFRHTRGIHSQGVHRIASFWCEQHRAELPPQVIHAVQIAALLHDIGHSAFSHSAEYVLSGFERYNVGNRPFDHDEFGCHQIMTGEIGDIIRAHEHDTGVTPEMVVAILQDDVGLGYLVKEVFDRLDYLTRDMQDTRFPVALKAEVAMVQEWCLGVQMSVAPGSDPDRFDPAAYRPFFRDEPIKGALPPSFAFAELRKALFQEYSLHPQSLLVNSIISSAILDAERNGALLGKDIRLMTDREAISCFSPEFRTLLGSFPRKCADEFFDSTACYALSAVRPDASGRDRAEFVASRDFALQVKAYLQSEYPELRDTDIFVCATPDYSKTIKVPVRTADGIALREVRSKVRLEDRVIFLAVANRVNPEICAKATGAFKRFMADYLASGAVCSTVDILSNYHDPVLFLDLGSKAGSPMPKHQRRKLAH